MTAFTGEFTLPPLERVISGPGSITALPRELDRLGCTRPIVVTGRTLGASPLLQALIALFPPPTPRVFAGARQHVPRSSVSELVAFVRAHEADSIVSFGGGSPIDTAKAAVHMSIANALGARPLLHVAVPTTLSAGEFTPVAGVTDDNTRVKRAIHDPRVTPRVVILDPDLTLATPDWLWAASGIRALDHAVEAIYSSRHHPLGDTLATKAIQLLVAHLPASINAQRANRGADRARCQMAAWFAVFGMINAGFGLSHVFGHQIGPRWNVPHGVTSCIILPHAMRFMAHLAPDRFGPIAEGYGLSFSASAPLDSALACADRTAQVITALGLPTRLRDVQVPRAEMDAIAGVIHQALGEAGAVDRPVAREEILAVLADAY